MASRTYKRTTTTDKSSGIRKTTTWNAQTGRTTTSYSTKGGSFRNTWSYEKNGVKRTMTRSNGDGSYTIFTNPKSKPYKPPKLKPIKRSSRKKAEPITPLGFVILVIAVGILALFSK